MAVRVVGAPAGTAAWPAAAAERQMLLDLPFELDIANYSLVKSWVDGRHGTTYPGMPWEPKASFQAVAGYYRTH